MILLTSREAHSTDVRASTVGGRRFQHKVLVPGVRLFGMASSARENSPIVAVPPAVAAVHGMHHLACV